MYSHVATTTSPVRLYLLICSFVIYRVVFGSFLFVSFPPSHICAVDLLQFVCFVVVSCSSHALFLFFVSAASPVE